MDTCLHPRKPSKNRLLNIRVRPPDARALTNALSTHLMYRSSALSYSQLLAFLFRWYFIQDPATLLPTASDYSQRQPDIQKERECNEYLLSTSQFEVVQPCFKGSHSHTKQQCHRPQLPPLPIQYHCNRSVRSHGKGKDWEGIGSIGKSSAASNVLLSKEQSQRRILINISRIKPPSVRSTNLQFAIL